jgi:hypothetical protein
LGQNREKVEWFLLSPHRFESSRYRFAAGELANGSATIVYFVPLVSFVDDQPRIVRINANGCFGALHLIFVCLYVFYKCCAAMPLRLGE